MATARRRPTRPQMMKSVAHSNARPQAPRSGLPARMRRAAVSPVARIAYAAVGAAGLAALAIALFGPKRFQREILDPARNALGGQAETLWQEAKPLRRQLGDLFDRAAGASGRDTLIRNFQSWIGHFKAT